MLRRARLSDDARERRTPPLWRVWQVSRANLVALLFVVFIAYPAVGYLVVHNAREDVRQSEQEAAERRAALCEAITEKAPEALARAFQQPLDSPELIAYKADLKETLGFCGDDAP